MLQAEFAKRLAQAYAGRKRAWIAVAQTPHGMIPVALVTAVADGHRLYPHVAWFPDAGARNKMEVAVKFFDTIGREHLLIVVAEPTDIPFCRRLCRYTKAREVGYIGGYYRDRDGTIFVSHE